MWRSDAARLKFALKDGQQVVCRGRISVYEARGEYQLIVDSVEPKGKGALQLAFEQLKEKLRAEGLFEPARKRKLPLLPKRDRHRHVAQGRGPASTSCGRSSGAGAEARGADLPGPVQGEGAARPDRRGDRLLSAALGDLDAIIVGRGGGSIEDLWAFNEEIVARAIARSPVPVISAVGHEVDFTIADFVADIRASTPTAAAEMVVETAEAFAARIDNLERRAVQGLKLADRGAAARGRDVLAQHRIFENFKVAAPEARPGRGRARGAGLGGRAGRAAADRRGAGAGGLAAQKIAAGVRRRIVRERKAAWENARRRAPRPQPAGDHAEGLRAVLVGGRPAGRDGDRRGQGGRRDARLVLPGRVPLPGRGRGQDKAIESRAVNNRAGVTA